jgi:hypothetical protein
MPSPPTLHGPCKGVFRTGYPTYPKVSPVFVSEPGTEFLNLFCPVTVVILDIRTNEPTCRRSAQLSSAQYQVEAWGDKDKVASLFLLLSFSVPVLVPVPRPSIIVKTRPDSLTFAFLLVPLSLALPSPLLACLLLTQSPSSPSLHRLTVYVYLMLSSHRRSNPRPPFR